MMDTDVRQTGRDIFKGEDCSEFHLMLDLAAAESCVSEKSYWWSG